MAATDSTAFPVKGQAFRLRFRINLLATGNPVTTGLADLAAEISQDDGAFAASDNAPVEIGTTGYGYIDLTADEMDCNGLIVAITTSTSGAVEFAKEIVPLHMDEFEGRYEDESVIRYEQQGADIHAFLWNENEHTGAEFKLYNRNGSLKATATVNEGDLTAERGELG